MSLAEEVRILDESGRWNPAFQMINLETRKQHGNLDTKVARMPENRSRNRYRDVLPYDGSRIILESSDDGDYINANLVEVPAVDRKYILTQGPLPHTCEDFWRMIWEQKSTAVVMLNKIIEKNTVKCHPYWPMGEREVIEFEEFKITNQSESMSASYITREFLLENTISGESRSVKHFHYVLWPDFGVPKDPNSFLLFLEDVRQSGALSRNVGPPIVHCSAGIGRSGTFCLVDSALALAEKQNTAEGLNLTKMLLGLRKYRLGLIQTAEQLRFAFLAVIEGLSRLFPIVSVSDEESETASKRSKLDIVENNEVTPEPYQSHRQRNTAAPAKPPRVNKEVPNENIQIEQERQKRLYEKLTALESSEDDDEEEEVIDLSDMSDEDNMEAISPRQVHVENVENNEYASKPLPPLPPEHESDSEEQANKSPVPLLPVFTESDEENADESDSDVCEDISSEVSNDTADPKITEPCASDETETPNVETAKVDVNRDDVNMDDVNRDDVNKDNTHTESRSSLESRRGPRHEDSQSIKSEASESTDEVRQRRAKRAAQTKELVDNIKKKMIKSEMSKANQSMWLRSGIALGICAGLFIVYKVFF